MLSDVQYVEWLKLYLNITKYAKAFQGNLLTTDKIHKEANRSGAVGDWYHETRKSEPYITNEQYLLQFTDGKHYGADCVGLVKAPLMGNKPGGKSDNYNANYDYSIESLAKMCTDVKTDVKKGAFGEFMWTADYSHCAVITKAGKTDIESAPSLDGVAEVPLDYQPNWYKCGKLPFVSYGATPEPAPVDKVIKAGDVVTIQNGAVYGGSDKGTPVPSQFCRVPYRVDRVQEVKNERCALIGELNSWVPVRYLTKVNVVEGMKVGSHVKIKSGARYGGKSRARNTKVPKQFIGKTYTVSKVGLNLGVREALIKELNSWVPKSYLTLVK